MSDFLKTWEKTKKQFGVTVLGHLQTGGAGVPADVRKAVIELVKTETGFTPALKAVDAAFAKGHRAVAMKALTKVHSVIEQNTKVFQKAAVYAMNASNEATDPNAGPIIMDIASCIKEFNTKVIAFETDIAKKLESLQEAKGTDGVKINIISLEGDMKGAAEKFKSDVKKFATLEKKFKVLDRVAKSAKVMRDYSDAAARTQVTDARVALEAFFDSVDDLDTYRKVVEKDKSAPDADYVEAIEKLCTAFKAIKNTRGKASLANLKQLEADGVG